MYEIKNRIPNFELYPVKTIEGMQGLKGVQSIIDELQFELSKIEKSQKIVCIDYYYGVDENIVRENLVNALSPELVIDVGEARFPEDIISKKFGQFITEDRTNGVFSVANIEDFFDSEKLVELREKSEKSQGLVVIYGVGASLVTHGDICVYGSISYQTIKDRFEKGLDNWGCKKL